MNAQIAEVTDDLGELKTEKTCLINRIGVGNDEFVKRSKVQIKTECKNMKIVGKAKIRAKEDRVKVCVIDMK